MLGGLASGLVSVSAAGGGNGALLAYLTPLPVVAIGLTQGRRSALVAVAAATVLVLLFGGSALAGLVAQFLLGTLPALVLVFVALRDPAAAAPPGLMVTCLVVVALVVLLGCCAALPTHGIGIEDWIGAHVARYIDEAAPTASTDLRAMTAKVWTALLPALVGAGWVMLAVVNGLLGQWIASRSGRALRPSPDLLGLSLPLWLLAPLAAALGVGWMAGGDLGYLARNAAALLLTPYVFLGVTVVHRWLRQRPAGGYLVPLFYVVFFVLFGWAMVVLAGIGLAKQWRGLRQKKAASQEDQ